MSEVLYQKYRPKNFDSVVGQDTIVQILKNSIAQGKVGHAYLFVGPRGTGKTSTARIFAKAINAHLSDGNPDPEAESSIAIDNGSFIDLIEVDAASNRGIDEVRDLKEKVNFAPVQGKMKVYIVDEVHMMTKEAFNALLKTLEEPPKHVVFILATTEVHKVPATILSRCQRFDFKLGNKEKVLQNIEEILKKESVEIDAEGLDLIYESSGGSFRDSLSILELVVQSQITSDQPSVVTSEEVRAILGLPDNTMVYYFLDSLVKNESVNAINLVSEISSKGIDLHQFVFSALAVLRRSLINKLKDEPDVEEASFAKTLNVSDIVKLISLFSEADQEIKYSAIASLPLEVLIAKYLSNSSTVVGNSAAPVTPEPKTSRSGDSDDVKLNSTVNHKTIENSESKKVASKSVKQSIEKPDEAKVEVTVDQETPKTDVSRVVKALSFEELSAKWNDFIEKVKPFNNYFYMFLSKASVKEVSDSRILLLVPYSFHKDRIEEPANREILKKVMLEIWGQALRVDCEVDTNLGVSAHSFDSQNIISSGKEPKREDQTRIVKKSEAPLNSAQTDVKDRVNQLQKSISKGGLKNDKDIDPGVMSEVLDVFV